MVREEIEIVELLINEHEPDKKDISNYEIIHLDTKRKNTARVRLCYRDKTDNTIVILAAKIKFYHKPIVVDLKYVYVGKDLIVDMYKAIENS